MHTIVLSDVTDKFVVLEVSPSQERHFSTRVLPYVHSAYSITHKRFLKSKNFHTGPASETMARLLLQTWRTMPVVAFTLWADGTVTWEDPSNSGFFVLNLRKPASEHLLS